MLGKAPDATSCDGTVRSLVWDEGQGGTVGISAGEDGFVRYVALLALALALTIQRWWDLRTLTETASLDLGEPVSSMELAHGGGTLSVTSGKSVHFLDIMRYVAHCPSLLDTDCR